MQPTRPVASGMPTGHQWMGWWGDMGGPKQRGITQYGLSPFEQATMRGAFTSTVFNGYKRIVHLLPYIAPSFVLFYSMYTWGKNKNEYYNSKQGHKEVGGP